MWNAFCIKIDNYNDYDHEGYDDTDHHVNEDADDAHGWRPRGGKRAQRDTAPKVIVIDFAEIQNWGRC